MLLSKWTQFHVFTIWTPRYRDKVVLLAKRKVGEHNKVIFSGDPKTGYNMMGEAPYYVSGSVVKKCKLENNGSIDCYAVPIDKLEHLQYDLKDMREFI